MSTNFLRPPFLLKQPLPSKFNTCCLHSSTTQTPSHKFPRPNLPTNPIPLDLWPRIKDEARAAVHQESILRNYYSASILSHDSMDTALANHISTKLADSTLPVATLHDLFIAVLREDREIMRAVCHDLLAVKERDPACFGYVHCFLNFKGFLACQTHRIGHNLWRNGRKILALLIQNRVSEVFAVDICCMHDRGGVDAYMRRKSRTPKCIINELKELNKENVTSELMSWQGGTETAVIGDNVSILHNVTLGGTGKVSGDRHPKIGNGVLIGAGTCVLGNVRIEDGAKIGAGSVVLKQVPARTTAVGNPARLIGGKENPIKLDKIPSFTMDQTSHISDWSNYVI
ncbi:hypothetical protein SASPL_117384 [Salvia splendens]|uniref:serine O-acetyltransferase n=1 Tax=Salvia splendens TaxID=180675 RepID=A0A8X8ZW87_SALSN|nr:hypothetical protein SASPL_117384 [Salvia splendens]